MIEVTQADREAAIKIFAMIFGNGHSATYALARSDRHFLFDELARHRIAALEEAAKVAAWQPIETAPFDQMILLHCPHTAPKTSVGCCAEDCGWLIVEYDMMGSNCEPTHWMPIPKGPTDEH